jgi:hypothetical protein
MTKLATATFKGKSGNEYPFNVYTFDTNFSEVGAVYIVTKRIKSEETYNHSFIYIGQTDNLKERFTNHHKQTCFEKNNANCICTHQEDNEKTRLVVESDLINANNTPCND